ncbi:hypothetical protein J6590_099888 [Homalodisca vitripennis]|nr:hypothetical protein J6590_099888 [Homalodisca vitripennis]
MKNGPRGPSRLVFSSKKFLFGVLFNLFLTLSTYVSLAVDFRLMLKGRPLRMVNKTGALAVILDSVSLHLLALSVFFSSLTKHQIFIEMCSILDRIDKKLCYNYDKSKIKIRVYLVISYVIALLFWNVLYDFLHFLEKNQAVQYVMYVPILALYFAPALLFVQFTFVTEGITESLRNRGKQLISIFFHGVRQTMWEHQGSSTHPNSHPSRQISPIDPSFHPNIPTLAVSVAKVQMTSLLGILSVGSIAMYKPPRSEPSYQ